MSDGAAAECAFEVFVIVFPELGQFTHEAVSWQAGHSQKKNTVMYAEWSFA